LLHVPSVILSFFTAKSKKRTLSTESKNILVRKLTQRDVFVINATIANVFTDEFAADAAS